jgi:hypothetical protein
MSINKKNKKKPNLSSSTNVNNLSSSSQIEITKNLEQKLYDTLNAVELKKSMDKWLRTAEGKNATIFRDLSILKGINEEYLSSFITLGYTMEGERVVLQSYSCPKDKDALMEFLKNVFMQNHQNSSFDE